MARIRTVKPEFFKHLELFELEEETGLPLRVAFPALWTVADREGRFKWIPRQLKIECLPYDNIDFSRVLHALASREFIKKYTVNFVEYGWIPGFKTHQVINNRESESVLPEPGEFDDFTRDARVNHASTTRENDPENTPEMGDFRPENNDFTEGVDKSGKCIENNDVTRGSRVDHACSGEGKGKEGKGREYKIPMSENNSPPESLDETRPEPPQKKFKFSADQMTFAQGMFKLIRKVAPTTKEPNFDAWANDIRLINEIDKQSLHEMADVFRFANRDSFWRTNILSPGKFREKYSTLHAKWLEQAGNTAGATVVNKGNVEVLQRFLQSEGEQ